MLDKFEASNFNDENGNPAGGSVTGTGLSIDWQNGPLGRGDDRREPNGAFVETVIAAAISRIDYYQESKFACADNAEAVLHLRLAMECLGRRTKARESAGVEGTHVALKIEGTSAVRGQTFMCFKKVQAFRITNLKSGENGCFVIGDGGSVPVSAEYFKKHDPKVGGYFVVYDDGSQSFSPSEPFEAGYARL